MRFHVWLTPMIGAGMRACSCGRAHLNTAHLARPGYPLSEGDFPRRAAA